MRALVLVVLTAAALLVIAARAEAGSFSVNPIRLEIKSGQNATSLKVSNHGSEPSLLQVRVFHWRHGAALDELVEPEAGVAPVITPPLFKLAGGGATQVIRIGFATPLAPDAPEAQWRVVVEEVPQPQIASEAAQAQVAIAMRLRVSLPLFRRPAERRQDLHWQAQQVEGALQLAAHNRGTVTERLDALQLTGSSSPLQLSGPIYVFPGERRLLSLKSDTALRAGTLQLAVSGTPRESVRELEVRAQ